MPLVSPLEIEVEPLEVPVEAVPVLDVAVDAVPLVDVALDAVPLVGVADVVAPAVGTDVADAGLLVEVEVAPPVSWLLPMEADAVECATCATRRPKPAAHAAATPDAASRILPGSLDRGVRLLFMPTTLGGDAAAVLDTRCASSVRGRLPEFHIGLTDRAP